MRLEGTFSIIGRCEARAQRHRGLSGGELPEGHPHGFDGVRHRQCGADIGGGEKAEWHGGRG